MDDRHHEPLGLAGAGNDPGDDWAAHLQGCKKVAIEIATTPQLGDQGVPFERRSRDLKTTSRNNREEK